MWSLFISFIAYVVSSFYISKKLEDYLPSDMTKKIVVFLLASIVSWIVAILIDWIFPGQALHLLDGLNDTENIYNVQ